MDGMGQGHPSFLMGWEGWGEMEVDARDFIYEIIYVPASKLIVDRTRIFLCFLSARRGGSRQGQGRREEKKACFSP